MVLMIRHPHRIRRYRPLECKPSAMLFSTDTRAAAVIALHHFRRQLVASCNSRAQVRLASAFQESALARVPVDAFGGTPCTLTIVHARHRHQRGFATPYRQRLLEGRFDPGDVDQKLIGCSSGKLLRQSLSKSLRTPYNATHQQANATVHTLSRPRPAMLATRNATTHRHATQTAQARTSNNPHRQHCQP